MRCMHRQEHLVGVRLGGMEKLVCQTNERLDDEARQRSCEKYDGHAGF